MNLVSVTTTTPVPHANPGLVDGAALERELKSQLEGEVRFDAVSRALYSTDASVYQIHPLGVVLPKTREDLVRIVRIAGQYRCPVTMRGGGTAQAGQAIGAGLQVDISKYYNRLLELNAAERWVRVEPGIVLDDLNAQLKPHGLRFAPDVSTASRATVGGMMGNNSSGARSVLYGKTIDHVLAQEVLLADGTIASFRQLDAAELETAMQGDTLEAECYRSVRRVSTECADEVERRFPKVIRRVGGYNLDEFTNPDRPFNMAKMMVGSEGTLGVVLEATLNLVPLPNAKAVLMVQFNGLLEALAATPLILHHRPSAVEVMDKFLLDHTHLSPNLQRARETFIEGDPGAILCIEFYDDAKENLPPRLAACEEDLVRNGFGYRYFHALELPVQAKIWNLREAALGLSMTMKEDAKSISFVEDTAVSPEKLRDYIERFLEIISRHNTTAGVYAHASVGCLHVRPVVNMKTGDGIRKFEAIATEVSDLVLEFGGALSGEHGDGLVRGPFMQKMFGPILYDAFRTIKRTFDPAGIFNPGKIVDCPPLTDNLRFGAGYVSPSPRTYFDYSDYGGMGGAVEMCSGLGVCRKTLEGTMCPSYMATKEESHTTRGRANVLRLAMGGRLASAGLDERGVYEALDLCLECRACKAECPVGVDMARFKSEFLANFWQTYGTPLHAKMLGNVRSFAKMGSPFASIVNWISGTTPVRLINEAVFGVDHRRTLPALARKTLASEVRGRGTPNANVLLFNDTFTNFYDPHIGVAAWDVLEASGVKIGMAPNHCCGRPLISKGLLKEARDQALKNTKALYDAAAAGKKFVFCEPSCLSAVREDAPSLLRGEDQRRAKVVADACVLFEEFACDLAIPLKPGPPKILLHGHCHQKSMGLLPVAKTLLEKIPGTTVVDLDAGCCGMAGSFGYSKEHFDVSRKIAERRLLPQVRARDTSSAVVAAGTSCRHQIADFTDERAVHPAVLLQSLLQSLQHRQSKPE
ncbi:MAG TPA: FAD-linked oxidase C-terminal domain-containing protein [Bryobacteraceae bacterium]|nr:FAD-linked oxidase C-terminal domain-containing protein [Bryobacteraceae bacterium]